MTSNATATTAANVSTLPTAAKAQTAKEVIAENIKLLIAQLEAGHSEGLTAYLAAMGKFHNYSLGNILEIARQKPDATRVAGLYAWNQLGRKVRKGQKGIRILAPVIGIRRRKDSEAEKDIAKQNQPVLVGFRAAYVFDVSQTEGAELPDLKERVKGEVGEYRERLIEFIAAQGIELEFKESIAPALGMSYGGRITILPGQAAAEEFSTLVHELAHEMLHKAERRTATIKTIRETEAEAIAFVVSQTIGLDAGRASADYIHLYHDPPVSRQRRTPGRELGSHSEDLRPHSLRHRDGTGCSRADRSHNRAAQQHQRHRCSPRGGGLVQTVLLILKAAGGWYPGLSLKIENLPYMALVIEGMDESGPMGLPAISVAHYGEQNGDAMRDPEMIFELGLADGPHLNPFYYRNDYMGVEQWSRNVVRDHYLHLVELHKRHERFAKTWDNNLRLQGFAEAFERHGKHRP